MILDKRNRLILAILISSIFIAVEVLGGYLAKSLAIYNDAAHLAIDASGFVLALLALIASERKGDERYTYGYGRIEVFGALVSVLSLWLITFLLASSAYYKVIRWFSGNADNDINGKLMFVFGIFGVFVNIILAYVFNAEHGDSSLHMHDHSHGHSSHSDHSKYQRIKVKSYQSDEVEIEMSPIKATSNETTHDHSHDHHGHHDHHDHHDHHECHHDHHECSPIKSSSTKPISYSGQESHQQDANTEAAYLHVLTDLIQSVGVAVAGLVIWINPDLQILDPLCVFLFTGLVITSTLPLMKKIIIILMEGAPLNIDSSEVSFQLKSISTVTSVNHLHIWSISSNVCIASVQIEARETHQTLKKAKEILQSYGIEHSTVQVRKPDDSYNETSQDLRHNVPLCV